MALVSEVETHLHLQNTHHRCCHNVPVRREFKLKLCEENQFQHNKKLKGIKAILR